MSKNIETFTATVTALPTGVPEPGRRGFRARLVPFGRPIDHGGKVMQFDAGSIEMPTDRIVPLLNNHWSYVNARIGRLVSAFEDADAAYGDFIISDTRQGRDVVALLDDGALTDVSVGIEILSESEDDDGVWHRAGVLDHVATVHRGAFPEAKVMSVHSHEGETMEPDETATQTTETVTLAAEPAEVYDDSALRSEVSRLADAIDLAGTGVTAEPQLFANMKEFVLTFHAASQGDANAAETMAKHRAAQEAEGFALDTADTTDAAGLVPDYLSSQIIGLIDDFRPSVNAFGRIDAGSYGMSVVLPKVTVKPTVAAQSAEFVEPDSTSMDVAAVSFDLETYAGAGRVSVQLIERSQPSYVDRLIADLAGAYAATTDAAFIAALVAGVGTNTAILADFSADAAATYAAILAGVGAVAGDIKRPADRLIVATSKWLELMALVDSEGRPLILPANVAQNPQGVADGNAWRFRYFPGLEGIHDPHAAADSCLIGWSGAAASIETAKQQVRAVQVGVLGMDIGVWGLFTDALLYAGNVGGLYSITAA